MSSVVISGDTSGAITLSAPAVAGTNTITLPASTGTVITTGSPQSGSVLQVVSTFYNAQISQSSTGTWSNIAGLTASITPKFSTSKILVMVSVGKVGQSGGTQTTSFRLTRGGSGIGVGSPSGSQVAASFSNIQWVNDSNHAQGTSYQYLDSPTTTSSTSYSVDWYPQTGNTAYLNRNAGGGTGSETYNAAAGSSITLMEIAQ